MTAPKRTDYRKPAPGKQTAAGKTPAADKAAPPVHKIRVGLVFASIWANDTDKGTFYNVTFETRYKDDTGEWHSGKSYGDRDLLSLMKAADLAHTFIVTLQQRPAVEAADDHDPETGEVD